MKHSYLKKLFTKTALLALLAGNLVQAQDSYTVESIPYNSYGDWGTFIFTSPDDSNSDIITLPFDFTFYGNTYNKIVISPNGSIDFRKQSANTTSGWSFNTPIPNTAFPVKNSILCMHDLYNANSSNDTYVKYSVNGTLLHRVCVITFKNQHQFQCSDLISTFQIALYETSNEIEIMIKRKDLCSTWNNGNAVVGIINSTGALAQAAPGRNTGAWSVSEDQSEGWRFKPDAYPFYKYTKCDADNNGFETFNLAMVQAALSPSAVFYPTQQDAQTQSNVMTATQYTNLYAHEPTTIYARYDNQIIPVTLGMINCGSIDYDNDNMPISVEDLNNDGNLANDDTDADGLPNYMDNDDDGDLLLTINEDTTDTDGDGLPNYLDNDEDNDGLSTNHGDRSDIDTDGDSLMDYLDNDDDGDGILTINEGDFFTDTDEDSLPDFWDNDDDGDGILTLDEGTADTDGDTLPNYLDTDDDGDGLFTIDEGNIDTDGDAVPDYLDADDDGDGVPTLTEGVIDNDGDTLPNYLDADDDNDEVPTLTEGVIDTDGDTLPNYVDTDDDSDGFPTLTEGTIDTDGDGIDNYLDTDDDGDGLLTIDEGNIDTDGDEVPDYLDADDDADGVSTITEGTIDTDGDEVPNYLDTDDDNDGVPTLTEGAIDTDGDGIDNYLDTDDDGDMILTSQEYVFGKGTESFIDTDGDAIENYLDNDDDGDGILTINEGTIDTDGDLIANYLDNDDDGDGVLTIDEDYNHNGDLTDDDTNGNGIPDYLDNTVALSVTASTLEKGISLYPNPVAGILNIANHTGLEISDISVYSVNGVKVKQAKTSDAMMVSDLQSGLYIVKIQVDNQVLNYKFVKK